MVTLVDNIDDGNIGDGNIGCRTHLNLWHWVSSLGMASCQHCIARSHLFNKNIILIKLSIAKNNFKAVYG